MRSYKGLLRKPFLLIEVPDNDSSDDHSQAQPVNRRQQILVNRLLAKCCQKQLLVYGIEEICGDSIT